MANSEILIGDILARVDEICNTIIDTQNPDISDKLNEVKTQVSQLRTILLNAMADKVGHHEEEVPRSQISEDQAEGNATKIDKEMENKQEDSVLNRWTVCTCDKKDCFTCTAEQEATLSATKWFDSQPAESICNNEEKENTDKRMKLSSKEKASAPSSRYHAACILSDEYYRNRKTNWLIWRLHLDLSITGFSTYPVSSNCCGLVAIFFGRLMIKHPNVRTGKLTDHSQDNAYLTAGMHGILTVALQDGIGTYIANYRDSTVHLQHQDIILIYSDLGFHIKYEMCLDETTLLQTLTNSILHLEERQLMLLVRLEDYKVLSVVNRYDNSWVLIYDSQCHTMGEQGTEEVLYGGLIYEMQKQEATIADTLVLLEQHSGKLKGQCQMAILEL